jgi:DNA-binding NarL/FixJ family response regulator
MYADQFLVHQALQIGVHGYLLKHALMEELLSAIRSVYRGEVYLSPAVTEMPVPDRRTAETGATRSSLLDLLSAREREVLKLIAEGHTNNEVADLLSISVKTVEKHRASVMDKLNIHDLPGLVRIAVKYGLIFLEE